MALETGSIVEGKVFKLTPYGVLVELPDNHVGLIHISEIANTYVHDVGDYFAVGDPVRAKVISQGTHNRVELSIKKAIGEDGIEEPKLLPGRQPPPPPSRSSPRDSGDMAGGDRRAPRTFEDKLTDFLKRSEDRQLDYRRSRDIRRRKRKR